VRSQSLCSPSRRLKAEPKPGPDRRYFLVVNPTPLRQPCARISLPRKHWVVTSPIYRTRSIIDLDRSKIVQVLTLLEPANAACYF